MAQEINNNSALHVLIVDDVEINVEILGNIMEQLGYIPLPAGSAQEALKIIRQVLPELILLDVSMPEMDGYELCTILKKNPVTREIPVIFISALDSLKDRLRGLELGAADFITKPFEITEVTMRVKNQMENYRMKQELEAFNRRLHKMLTEQTQKIENGQRDLLCALAYLTEKRSKAASGHLDNVGFNSRILASSLQLSSEYETEISEDFIDMIETAAKLHDIGKLLDPSEESHTENGVYLLQELMESSKQTDFMEMAVSIVRFHHVRWADEGKEIPLAARIVCLADGFDKLLSEYGDQDNALEEGIKRIKDCSGIMYDPELVQIFSKVQRQLRIN